VVLSFGLALGGCAAVEASKNAILATESREEIARQRQARAERSQQLSDEQIERRVAFISERLDDNQLHAQVWQYGWLVVNAGGMVVGSVNGAKHSGTDQVYDIIQATKGGVGTAFLLLDPVPGRSGAESIREMPAVTRADKLARLARAEDLLSDGAQRARRRLWWPFHLANITFNAIGGAILLGLEDYKHAGLSFGVGAAVGEIEILTAPWEPTTDWEEYERFAATDGAVATAPAPRWRVVTRGSWVGVEAEF
jgi:hypothetical protein